MHSLKLQLEAIPQKNFYRANRYNTDDQLVLHVWDEEMEQSYDIVIEKKEVKMQELIKAIEKKKEGIGDLRVAAINWAKYCIREMKDETLKRGLIISMALADFEIHLEELK